MNRPWPDLEVRVLTGCPTLCLDGKPWFGMAVERPFAGDHVEAFERLAGVGVRHFHLDATCAEDIYHPELRFWTGPGTFDPSAHDAMLHRLLAIRPDAMFTLRVFAGAPDWWLDANPGHWQIYADGTDRRAVQRAGIRRLPSLASPQWKADLNGALERFILWLMESGWSQRIAGIFVSNGITWEWGLLGSDGLPDYSPHARDYFRTYLHKKYRTNVALSAAWGREARLDEVDIPTGAERLRGFGENGLRELPACQSVIDHQQSISAMNVDLLLSLVATAKRVSERRAIIGAFYGYTITAREQNEFTGMYGAGGFVGGHHELSRVLRSRDIDFLASPFHYANRKLGTGLLWEHVPLASVYRHGKAFWDENDLWTYTNPPGPRTIPAVMDVGYTPTLRETILTYRRAWAIALARGKHQWLTELTNWIGNFRENFSDPDFLQEIGRLHAASDELLQRDRSPVTQVAYVIDEESIAFLSPDHKGFLSKVYYGTVRWARLGAPFDVILLSDLLAGSYEYRLVVPACVKSPGAISALKAWAEREGTELFWDGTAAWYPPDDNAPLHDAYAHAGVHQYLPGEQAYANASMLVAHVDEPGVRTVRLPCTGSPNARETHGMEFFSGQSFVTENGKFSWEFQDKDVRLFCSMNNHPSDAQSVFRSLAILRFYWRKLRVLVPVFLVLMSTASLHASTPLSLSQFDQKASHGEPVSVVFFGGSLTWGANASDPGRTSYRGRMMQYLQDKYPKTAIRFHDAAIGGTGSALGMFRLERDVLAYKPDLVFLDFTVNDGEGTDMESFASYERCLRSIVSSGAGVMPVLFCFKYHMNKLDDPLPGRHQGHLKLAEAYHLPVANVYSYVHDEIAAKRLSVDDIWTIRNDDTHPTDGAHPGDEGYAVFFEVVKRAYEKAIASDDPIVIPEKPFFEDKYPQVQRLVLTDGNMPQGWKQRKTYRTSMWYDGLASRWMGDVATASAKDAPAPLVLKFTGSMVGIFGEHDSFTPPIKVFIDDQPVPQPKAKEGDMLWRLDTSKFAPPHKGSANLFMWQKFADVADGAHTLRVEPVWEGTSPDAQLRIESVCSAGH